MVTFTKLRLHGFKSFVDKTELEIGTGLNGIVGPNGCGKSNLVEALRWVMGEKSAKNMRGAGMEDVIFNGTSKRPARNMAEVSVILSNEDNSAPALFDSVNEIEINRKIEKDKGSQYRVNGRAVRARDVNLLFADTMTGATSPALVSQGRITEIITAKPCDRRKILEDSAGISGLHTRRHEAELRLRAATQNLTRVDDVLNDMRSRLLSLKRQSRQAERYKEFSNRLRHLDMALNWNEWTGIHSKIKIERDNFSKHNEMVQSAIELTKSLTSKIEDLEKSLPDARTKNIEINAVLQNFKISLERMEQDLQSKTKNFEDAKQSKLEVEEDCEFTRNQYNQTLNELDKTTQDLDILIKNGLKLPAQIENSKNEYQLIKSKHNDLIEQKQDEVTSIAITVESKENIVREKDKLGQNIEKLNQNISILKDKKSETIQKIDELKKNPSYKVDLKKLTLEIQVLETDIADATTETLDLSINIEAINENKKHFDTTLRDLKSELNALQSLVKSTQESNDISPTGEHALLNHLNVKSGYEKAVSSILGQWISMAGMDNTASVYWTSINIDIKHAQNSEPLINYVEAPASIIPLLKSVGVVDDITTCPTPKIGQIIVAKDGSFKRWDGLIVTAKAFDKHDQAGVILTQKNRVKQLDGLIEATQIKYDDICVLLSEKTNELNKLKDDFEYLKLSKSDKDDFITQHGYKIENLNKELDYLNDTYQDQETRLKQNKDEYRLVNDLYIIATNNLNSTDDNSIKEKQDAIAILENKIQKSQIELENSQQKLASNKQEQASIDQRKISLEANITRLNVETETLNKRQDELAKRFDLIADKILNYKSSQDHENNDSVREELLSKISTQTTQMSSKSIELEKLEKSYRDLQTQLRIEEMNGSSARENRASAQANVTNGEEDLTRIKHVIEERFELSPQQLESQIFDLFEHVIPNQKTLHDEKETVTRQRDAIGPVNLRAATESKETETELFEIEVECNDLTKAIEQLRSGIVKLNREAKERLSIAFQRVDLHFQKLFSDLFKGGKAYLKMIESDDPLETGLEIYAQPPGKSLQRLSLLSGGEQTLTSIALIFAMFLTNPSPICVLDEIDAPLDDANVDRVCGLMETIANETDTRFIVITHHRMTMARMDRLYGVTMSERGVSQLVSVDMPMQEELELAESA